MRTRLAFILSITLALLALALLFEGRGQLEQGYRIRRDTGQSAFPAEQSNRGAVMLYTSIPLAIASAVCAVLSRRRREPAWRWVTVVFLCLYLFVMLAPV